MVPLKMTEIRSFAIRHLRKKVLSGNPRQARTNYRCSDQGLAGFACRTSTAPDSPERENQPRDFRNAYFRWRG